MKAPETTREREALAAEYVIGLLDAAEMAAIDARLARDRGLAISVAAWRDRLVALDDTAVSAAPDPRCRQRLRAWATCSAEAAARSPCTRGTSLTVVLAKLSHHWARRRRS